MKYRELGNSGIKVSVVGHGTWALGGDFFGEVDLERGIRAIQKSVELGVNLIDTAPAYGQNFEAETAVGKAVKIIALLLTKLPLKGYRYKVLFMRRDIEEIMKSQKQMLIRRGESPDKISDEEMITTYNRHLSEVLSFLEANSCFTVFFVNYNDLMRDPEDWVPRIAAFLGKEIDIEAMKAVVDPNLYRNRR